MEVADYFAVAVIDSAAGWHFRDEFLLINEAGSRSVDGPEDGENREA